MSANQKTAFRAGLLLAGVWTLVLVAAFIVYPATDNVVTGFLIHAWSGVDALEAVSVTTVLGVAMLQIAACFGIGCLLGLLSRKR